MEDWDASSRQERPRPTLRPVFVAVLIIVACVALAVWTLQQPAAPPPEPPVAEAATPRPLPPATPTPAPTVAPTAAPTPAAPTEEPKTVLAVSTRIPLILPSARTDARTASPPPTPVIPFATRRPEPASLQSLSPRKAPRGRPTLFDVRGRKLRADHRVIVLRSGRVPADVAVPRQRYLSPALVQVVIVPGADAKGSYDVAVADSEGHRSNSVSFEVIP